MENVRLSRYTTLFLAAGIWFIGKFVRYAFPPLFETLQGNYEISNALMGTIYTALLTVYACLQFPSGMLSDRFGSVRVVVTGAILAITGSLLIVFDSPLIVLIVSMMLIGVGTGAHKTVSVQILSKVYPDRTGRVLGIFDTFGSYGGVAASITVTTFLIAPPALKLFVGMLPGASWRGVFLLSGISGLVLATGFAVYVPEQLPNDAPAMDDTREGIPVPEFTDYLKQLLKPRFFLFLVIAVLFSFSYNGVIAFLPLYLSEAGGLNTALANLLYSTLFAVSVVQILTGDISDRVGRLPIIVTMLGLSGVALVLSVVFIETTVVMLTAFVIIFAVGSHGFRPVRGVYFVELLPEWIAAGGLGVVRTLLMIAGAAAPPVVGYIADISNFRAAFALLALSMLGAMVLSGGLLLLEMRHPAESTRFSR